MRHLTFTFLVLVLAGCGEDGAPSSAPPVLAEATPPPHPSGASPEDVALLRWLQTTGWPLKHRADDACHRLSMCTTLVGSGNRDALQSPSEIAGCIDARIDACEQAKLAFEHATIPQTFERPLATVRDRAGNDVCYANAARELLAAHPEVVTRLRPANHGMAPPMRDAFRGWESIEQWAAANRRIAWVASYVDATHRCWDEFPGVAAAATDWPIMTRWLRERFFCPPAGCCTLERIGEMHEQGREPGPPDPRCGGG